MHSSTSSSSLGASGACPAPGSWRGTWIAVLVIVAVAVGGWEAVLRMRGLDVITVDDSAELWARERERAATLGRDAVILVGTSQMQMGIDLPTLARQVRGVPVQLAISASPFMPVFEDLANDPRITGTVIVSFSMGDFVRSTTDTRAAQWVERYRRSRASRTQLFNQAVEDTLGRGVDAALLSVATGARPQQLLFGGAADYVQTLPDRSQRADYSSVDREAAYRRRVQLYLSGEEPAFVAVADADERFARLETLVEKVRARGGEVVLVSFATTRRIREIDEIMYPKATYWDALAQRTTATTVHFADHESLAGFDLPDGVHLDYRDAPAFTTALAEAVFGGARAPGRTSR